MKLEIVPQRWTFSGSRTARRFFDSKESNYASRVQLKRAEYITYIFDFSQKRKRLIKKIEV